MSAWTKTLHDPIRHDTIWIDVLDQSLQVIGQIHPTSAPTVEVDVNATIPRRLSGITLDTTDAAALDPYGDRLRPVWRTADTDHHLGVFLWATTGYVRNGWGLEVDGATAHDQTFVLSQPFRESYGAAAGSTLTTVLSTMVEAAGIWDHTITTSPLTSSAPLAWPAGAARIEAVDAVASKLGYTWHFDGSGTFVAQPTRDPDVEAADHWYDEAEVTPGVPESDDLWSRPNLWLVISTSANSSPIVGTYQLPSTHPASIESRGYPVTDVIEEPGITSTAAATQRARDAANRAATSREITLTTTPNPAHDLHDLVSWRGTTYREVGWTLPLEVGAGHSHRLQRTDDADT